MTQTTMIEDAEGRTVEVAAAGGVDVELAVTEHYEDDDAVSISLVLSPRQARLLARQLLAMADDQEGGDDE